MRASFRIRSSALLRQSKLRCGLIPQTRRSYAKRHTVERIPTTTAREEVVSAPSNTKLTDELKERRRRKRVKLLWIVRALTFPFYIFGVLYFITYVLNVRKESSMLKTASRFLDDPPSARDLAMRVMQADPIGSNVEILENGKIVAGIDFTRHLILPTDWYRFEGHFNLYLPAQTPSGYAICKITCSDAVPWNDDASAIDTEELLPFCSFEIMGLERPVCTSGHEDKFNIRRALQRMMIFGSSSLLPSENMDERVLDENYLEILFPGGVDTARIEKAENHVPESVPENHVSSLLHFRFKMLGEKLKNKREK